MDARDPALALALAAGLLACGEREALGASELFESACTTCHVAPDPAFAVERAWLAQLADTA